MNGVSKRKTYYDFLRILCAFLVIFNHLPGYTLYQDSTGIKTWIYTLITMFTRINVLIFFMIAGGLLLSRSEEIGEVFRKRISRMTIVLFVFSALCYVIKRYPGKPVAVTDFLKKLLSGDIAVEYWYLYTYIAFLFALPYLQKVVRNFAEKDFICFMLVYFVMFSAIPIVNYILGVNGKEVIVVSRDLTFPLMTAKMFFYPIIGFYLDRKVDVCKIQKKQWICIWLFAIVGMFAESAVTIHQSVTTATYTQDYVQLFDYMIAIAVFLTVKYLFEGKDILAQQDGLQKTICSVGQLTLGIYVLDPIFRNEFWKYIRNFLEPYLPSLLVSLCWCFLSMCICGFITYLLKKIPGFRKIL